MARHPARRDDPGRHPLTPPTAGELESWAGRGRVLRAAEADVAAWRIPRPEKDALISSGVPLVDDLIREVSFVGTPKGYRLALDYEGELPDRPWEYVVVPETGEVRLWSPDERPDSSFVNSSIIHWLRSVHLVGTWLMSSTAIGHWGESPEAEEQALTELADLLRRIELLDPAAIADGDHERQFWPGTLDRWLY